MIRHKILCTLQYIYCSSSVISNVILEYFVTIFYHSRTLRLSTQDVHILIIFILKYFYLSLNSYCIIY